MSVLKSRSLVRMSGEGIFPFLQGLITQDVTVVQKQPAAAALFLNPKGRLISDCLIVNQAAEKSVLIDLPVENIDGIANLLARHKLRLPLVIEKIPWESIAVHVTDAQDAIPDPRGSFLANRVYAAPQRHDESEEIRYRNSRLLAGVIEGSEIGTASTIPIFFNFDLFNCISFNKGCYTGQELITRTLRRGVVRKRLFPVTVKEGLTVSPGDAVSIGSSQVGTVLTSQNNVGVALCQIGDALNEAVQIQSAFDRIDQSSVSVGSHEGGTIHLPRISVLCSSPHEFADAMSVYRRCSRLCGSSARQRPERTSKPAPEDDAVTHNTFDDDFCDDDSGGFASPGELSPPGPVVAPVSLVDAEGFEWAIVDGPPPVRPPGIPKNRPYIPLTVRAKKGFLYNQVLTRSEVPDTSPLEFSCAQAMVPMSLLQEQVLRALRAAAIDMHHNNGAHVRSFSRRRLLRNGAHRPRSGTDSSTVVSVSSRPPSNAETARRRRKLAASADTRGLFGGGSARLTHSRTICPS